MSTVDSEMDWPPAYAWDSGLSAIKKWQQAKIKFAKRRVLKKPEPEPEPEPEPKPKIVSLDKRPRMMEAE